MARRKNYRKKGARYRVNQIISLILACILAYGAYHFTNNSGNITNTAETNNKPTATETAQANQSKQHASDFDPTDYSDTAISFNTVTGQTLNVPQFDGQTYSTVVNNNQPFFSNKDLSSTDTWHEFSDLDKWGRVGVANAVVGPETLQTNARGSLAKFSPSGWYGCKASLGGGGNTGPTRCERSHLIANKLLGDVSDDEHNLVTGTHDFNANTDSGMLHWERMVMDAAEDGMHIRYRVTPIFDEKDTRVAGSVTPHGVLMEAESIEDKGKTVKFCVYVYNCEEGWVCDYTNGDWELIQH